MSTWKMNPQKRDYDVQFGSPVTDNSLRTEAYFRLMIPRTRWMYAPNSKYGSDFYTSHKRVGDVVEIENMARRATQPIIDDGRAKSIEVATVDAVRGAIEMTVKITDNQGNSEVLNFNSLGVK